MYILTKKKLLADLYRAFYDCRKHKSKKSYVKEFEKNLHNNLLELCEELYNLTYYPKYCYCYLMDCPCKREVFAAQFRDRIVHHLYYNYTYKVFEDTFIYDSYSCRVGKGTHFGIKRLKHHILSESDNYSKHCYCLKIDIRGYFMNINRNILLNIVLKQIEKLSNKKINNKYWKNIVDIDFIKYLSEIIILFDPTQNSLLYGDVEEYDVLPKSKTLFNSPEDCGLPIGNLTSQLFSNIYLNIFDQYIKRVLKCKHYGRYVDDSYIISCDRELLVSLIPKISKFLSDNLQLTINKGKTKIINVKYGVEFLGAFILPYRTYISNESLRRIYYRLLTLKIKGSELINSINSYFGVFSHYNSHNILMKIFQFL